MSDMEIYHQLRRVDPDMHLRTKDRIIALARSSFKKFSMRRSETWWRANYATAPDKPKVANHDSGESDGRALIRGFDRNRDISTAWSFGFACAGRPRKETVARFPVAPASFW